MHRPGGRQGVRDRTLIITGGLHRWRWGVSEVLPQQKIEVDKLKRGVHYNKQSSKVVLLRDTSCFRHA